MWAPHWHVASHRHASCIAQSHSEPMSADAEQPHVASDTVGVVADGGGVFCEGVVIDASGLLIVGVVSQLRLAPVGLIATG